MEAVSMLCTKAMELLFKLWGKAFKQIRCNQMSVANLEIRGSARSGVLLGFSTLALELDVCRSQPTYFAGNTKNNEGIAKAILAEGDKTDKGGTSFRELGQTCKR